MPHPTTTIAVRHPESGFYEALDAATDYPDDHILVVTYPWAFVPVEPVAAGRVVESVRIETAQAEPGQKRNRARVRG